MTISPKVYLPALLVVAAGLILLYDATVSCACSPKEKAYEASIKSDLKVFGYAQEEFFTDSGRFARSLDELSAVDVLSQGVTIRVLRADSNRFAAAGEHALLTGRACRLEVGESTRDSLWCYDR